MRKRARTDLCGGRSATVRIDLGVEGIALGSGLVPQGQLLAVPFVDAVVVAKAPEPFGQRPREVVA